MTKPDEGQKGQENSNGRIYLRRAMNAMAAYNERHNLGGMFAGMVLALCDEKEIEAATTNRKTADQLLSEVQLAEKDLAEIGLRFDFNEQAITMFHEGGQIKPKDLRLEIVDAAKLKIFLAEIETSDLEDATLKKDLVEMIRILTRQMAQYYESSDSRGTTVVENASALLSEFRRLGLSEAAQQIEIFWIHSTRHTLREFMSLRTTHCFEGPQSQYFGPNRWHRDATLETYEAYWTATERAIIASLPNRNAAGIILEALNNLIECAEAAIQDMEKIFAEAGATPSTYIQEHTDRIRIAKHYRAAYKQMQSRLAEQAKSRPTMS